MEHAQLKLDGADAANIHHPTYYWDLVVFKVEGTDFRIPTYGFLDANENFFSNFHGTITKLDNDAAFDTFILREVTKESFESLLLVLYPRSNTVSTFEGWVNVLHLATLWAFPEIRAKAIVALDALGEFKTRSPVDIIHLSKEYRISRWLHDGYARLLRWKVLSVEQLRPRDEGSLTRRALDWPTTSLILEARARITSPPDCKFCKFQNECSSRKEGYTPYYSCLKHATVDTSARHIIDQESMVSGITPERPAAGFRLPASENDFPDLSGIGPAPGNEQGRPMYFGSAIGVAGSAVVPCKIIPQLWSGWRVWVSDVGKEMKHWGRFDFLVFVPKEMEWVKTSRGRIPERREAIEGGYDGLGRKLYHAKVCIDNDQVFGKTGIHLGGAIVAYWGERKVVDNYWILCWR